MLFGGPDPLVCLNRNIDHMGMTPYQFFESFVEGNYYDFLENPGCVRRAFNAAVSASHLADHYFTYFEVHDPSKISGFKHIGDFVEHLSGQTKGSFRDIRSISNAYKHLYTSRDPKKAVHSSVSSTLAIECIEWTEKDSEVSRMEEKWISDPKGGDSGSKVAFTRKDGKQLDFLPVLTNVFKYWGKKFLSI